MARIRPISEEGHGIHECLELANAVDDLRAYGS